MDIQRPRTEQLDPDLITQASAVDWAFPVPDAFRDALDIIPDTRTENLVARKTWTQGEYYRFSVGDTIYDTLKAYNKWSEALQFITTCIQIVEASPANIASPGKVTFDVYHPDLERSKLVKSGQYTTTQTEFVQLLKVGSLNHQTHQTL